MTDLLARSAAAAPDVPPSDKGMPYRRFRRAVTELYDARDILANMVKRDFTSKHKNNVLGMAWSLLNPLLLVAIFAVVFKYFLGVRPTGGVEIPFAVFFFCGLTLWNLFATSVNTSVGSVVGGAYLIHKVFFPREILPIAAVFAAVIQFIFELIVLAVMILIVSIWGTVFDTGTVWPTSYILLMPLFVFFTVVLALGFSLLLSALTVHLRDMEHFVAVAIQAWFWLTPVIYSMELIQSKGRTWLDVLWQINPMTPLMIGFRNVTVLGLPPQWGWSVYSFTFATASLFLGYWYFRRQEPRFPELI